MAKARDKKTNDNFSAFVVRAATEEYKLDMNEISSARWFDTQSLLEVYDAAGRPAPWDKKTLPAPEEFAEANSLPRSSARSARRAAAGCIPT